MSINSKVAFWEQQFGPKTGNKEESKPRSPPKKRISVSKTTPVTTTTTTDNNNNNNNNTVTSPVDKNVSSPSTDSPTKSLLKKNLTILKEEKSTKSTKSTKSKTNSQNSPTILSSSKDSNGQSSSTLPTDNSSSSINTNNSENNNIATAEPRTSIKERMKLLQNANVNLDAMKPGSKPPPKKLDSQSKMSGINLEALKPGSGIPSTKKSDTSENQQLCELKFDKPIIPAGSRREKARETSEIALPTEEIFQDKKSSEEAQSPEKDTHNSAEVGAGRNNLLMKLEKVLTNHFEMDKTQLVPEKQVLLFLHEKYPYMELNAASLEKTNNGSEPDHKSENENNKDEKTPHGSGPVEEKAFSFDLNKWKVNVLDEAMCHVFGKDVRHEWGYTIKLIN